MVRFLTEEGQRKKLFDPRKKTLRKKCMELVHLCQADVALFIQPYGEKRISSFRSHPDFPHNIMRSAPGPEQMQPNLIDPNLSTSSVPIFDDNEPHIPDLPPMEEFEPLLTSGLSTFQPFSPTTNNLFTRSLSPATHHPLSSLISPTTHDPTSSPATRSSSPTTTAVPALESADSLPLLPARGSVATDRIRKRRPESLRRRVRGGGLSRSR